MNDQNLTGASLVIKYLDLINVEYIFCSDDAEVESMASAISSNDVNMTLIELNNEFSAIAMAESYYEETGRIGVVVLPVDANATNVMSGLNVAMKKEVSLLVITINKNITEFAESSNDIVSELDFCSKMSTLVSHSKQVGTKVLNAIMTAKTPPYGVVHLSIPTDVFSSATEESASVNKSILNKSTALFSPSTIDCLCEELEDKTFCLYLGRGSAKSINEIMTFIESTNTYFVIGEEAKGCVNERHPQYRGVYGLYGHRSAVELMLSDKVDCILAIGDCFIPDYKHARELFEKTVSFDFVERSDIDHGVIFRQFCCDLTLLFSYLLERVATHNFGFKNNSLFFDEVYDNKFNKNVALRKNYDALRNGNRIDPIMLMGELSNKLPDNARVYANSKKIVPWLNHYFFTKNSHRVLRLSDFRDEWTIAAGVSGAISNTTRPSICLVDNLAQIISSQVIKLVVKRKIPVIFIHLDMFSPELIKSIDSYNGLTINNHRHDTQNGCNLVVIKSSKQLINLDINRLLTLDKPSLVNIWVEAHDFFTD